MAAQKSEHCSKCNITMSVEGGETRVLDACYEFRRQHRHDTIAWVCYMHDMGVKIDAIFEEEIDALRHAVGSGFLRVAPVENGEIGNLP